MKNLQGLSSGQKSAELKILFMSTKDWTDLIGGAKWQNCSISQEYIWQTYLFLIFIVHTTQKLKQVMLDSHLQIIIFKTGHLMNDNVFEHPFLNFLKKSTLIVKVHTIFRTFLHIINQF